MTIQFYDVQTDQMQDLTQGVFDDRERKTITLSMRQAIAGILFAPGSLVTISHETVKQVYDLLYDAAKQKRSAS